MEEVLYGHPAVGGAAVIGIPDDYRVEKIHAVVTLKEEQDTTEEERINFRKAKLARYKAPKSVKFVTALPNTSTGKNLKRELREKFR